MTCVCISLGLGSCSIPSAGPATSDIEQKSKISSSGREAYRYDLFGVSESVLTALRRRPPESFRAGFGDYRPSAEPRIGVGDAVNVTIWEAAAGGLFSGPVTPDRVSAGAKSATIPDQVVGRDGSILVPYAGRIRVAGRMPRDVENQIVTALNGKAIEPQALVTVSRSVANTVTVTGEVGAAARIPLSPKGDRLLDVIASAGGVRGSVQDISVRLSRNDKTISVPYDTIVSKPREDIFLRPGDVLTLVREPQTFVIEGAAGANAQIPFESSNVSLSEALGKAGGLQDFRADPTGVFLFRYEDAGVVAALRPTSPLLDGRSHVPVVYQLDMRDPNSLLLAQRFPMHNKDVLFVTNSPSVSFQKAFQTFAMVYGTVAGGATTAASVSTLAK